MSNSDVTEQAKRIAKLEKSLAESEEKWQTLVEMIPAMVGIYQGLSVRYVNPAMIEATGYTRDELMRMESTDIVHPNFRELVRQRTLARQRGDNVPGRYIFPLTAKDGAERWVDFAAAMIRLDGEQVVLAVAFDVTQRKAAENALRESEARFRAIFQNAAIGIIVVDVKGEARILECNRALEVLLGYGHGELVGKRLPEITHPYDSPDVTGLYLELIRGRQPSVQLEHRYLHRSGRHVWCRWTATLIRGGDNEPRYTVGLIEDLTLRKQAEQSQRESERFVQRMADASPNILYVFDLVERRVLYTNHRTRDVLGLSPDEIKALGSDFLPRVVHPDDLPIIHQMIEKAMQAEDGEVIETEYRMRHADGSWRWLGGRDTVLSRDEFGRSRQVAGTAEDITERKAAADALLAEQRLLRQMLALQDRERRLIACDIHDGFIQDVVGAKMIVDSLHVDDEQADEHGGVWQKDCDTVARLLGKAIDEGRRLISELRPMIIEERGIVEALNYLVDEEEATGRFSISFKHDVQFDRLPPLLEGTVFRIVQEALNNVKRHSGTNAADIRLRQDDAHLVLEIEDAGAGFDRRAVPEDRFGIKGIEERARLFGGGAVINSTPGKGTLVSVRLPLDLPQEPVPPIYRHWAQP